ncbi:MAG TPA: glycosyltransferase family 4 protein, partial [Thermoanaerobaculia bacterium]
YDMFDAWSDGSAESRSRRDRIRKIDFEALSAIPDERRFAIGEEVAARLLDTLGLTSNVLHPPLLDADRFREGPFEHFLHAGRLHPWKRTDLVLRAYLSLSTDVPLLVTGSGEAGPDLRRLVGGDERVRFLGEVERPVLYDLFSRALAVPFVPLREDYGYVAIEAMLSGKPVITASDSGEPARLVENGVSGLVVAPRVDAIAHAFSRFLESPDEARRMGAAGLAKTAELRALEVADRLLAPVTRTAAQSTTVSRSPSRMRVLIVDNQPIEPPIGGGRIRLHGLYSNLPPDLDPVYVGTYDWPGPAYRSVLHEGRLREITVPQSDAHFRAHEALRMADPTLGMDVTFPALSFLSAAFAQRVAYEARDAEVIVFSHPWVLPVVRRIPGIEGKPFVYDAQNVEGPLRRAFLSKSGLGAGIAEMVENLERELCRSSAAIFACSEGDADEFVSTYGADPERVHVMPNGTDVRRVRPATPEDRGRARREFGLPADGPVALFLGSDYPPNLEAARTICRRLAPEMPALRFLIVGGCSDGLTPDEVPDNVTALGVVDGETRDRALAAADIAINPMRRG